MEGGRKIWGGPLGKRRAVSLGGPPPPADGTAAKAVNPPLLIDLGRKVPLFVLVAVYSTERQKTCVVSCTQ